MQFIATVYEYVGWCKTFAFGSLADGIFIPSFFNKWNVTRVNQNSPKAELALLLPSSGLGRSGQKRKARWSRDRLARARRLGRRAVSRAWRPARSDGLSRQAICGDPSRVICKAANAASMADCIIDYATEQRRRRQAVWLQDSATGATAVSYSARDTWYLKLICKIFSDTGFSL